MSSICLCKVKRQIFSTRTTKFSNESKTVEGDMLGGEGGEETTFFHLPDAYFSKNSYEKGTVKPVIVEHLTGISSFKFYLSDVCEQSVYSWAPLLLSEHEKKLHSYFQETLIEVCAENGLKLPYGSSSATCFWDSVEREHPDLGKRLYKKTSAICVYLSFLRRLSLH